MPHPDMSPNQHLIDIQHGVGLNSGCCGCRWNLKLKHLILLLKRGNHHCHLLKLEVLLLVGMLEVYDRVSATQTYCSEGEDGLEFLDEEF
jgi:hypothetical protein